MIARLQRLAGHPLPVQLRPGEPLDRPSRGVSFSAARQAAYAIDPDLALGVVSTLDELRDRSRGTGMASQFAKISALAL